MMHSQNKEIILQFIDDYRCLTALWDVNNPKYINKTTRLDCLKELAQKHQLSVEKVKAKIKSLRSYFSKEHAKVLAKKSGSGAEEVYVSSWFGYKPLLFIADTLTPNRTIELGVEEEKSTEENFDTCEKDSLLDQEVSQKSGAPFVKPTSSKRKVSMSPRDPKEEQAFKVMQLAVDKLSNNSKDEWDIFGEMVATKIKKFAPRNRAIAQHDISNYLFKMEIAEIDQSTATTSPCASEHSNHEPSHSAANTASQGSCYQELGTF